MPNETNFPLTGMATVREDKGVPDQGTRYAIFLMEYRTVELHIIDSKAYISFSMIDELDD